MARLYLSILGGFHLRVDAREIRVPAKKAQALLAYLALRPGRPHSRETLIGLLWGNASEQRARHSLRQTIFGLRKVFARAKSRGLVVRGDAIAFDPAAVVVDALEFRRQLRTCTPRALEAAVALYEGALLKGLHIAEEAFDEWLGAERQRFRDAALEALAVLLRDQTKRGAIDAAVQTATRLLALDPLQETVHRALMQLYARQDRRASALRQYQLCVDVLQRELGVEPEPETRRVYQDLLAAHVSPATPPDRSIAARRRALGSPLVGRSEELARLTEALEAVRRGRGRTVTILGEAGIGKTRLLEELSATAAEHAARVVVARGYETEQILPFGPWVEALRAGVDATGRDVLHALDPVRRVELARLLPELADSGLAPREPVDDYLRLFGAVARAIELMAAGGPLVLVLEDLHWADEMSVRLFGFVARRVTSWRCLLVGSARVEELSETPLLCRVFDELRADGRAVSLNVPSLSETEIRDLVRRLARAGTDHATLDPIAAQVWALSEGTPFVAVETMRALHEGHRFETATVTLPERVRDAIAGRLERLSPCAREILAVAAVVGRAFDFTLLQRAARRDAHETARGLEELVRRRVLHGVGARFDFTHDRVREVAYGRLVPPRRALLHTAVGRAIEALHANELAMHHGALGAHYRLGELWEKAVKHFRLAGARAMACSANREAVTCYEQALEALEHLPAGRSKTEQAHDLAMFRAAGYYALGQVRRVADELRDVEALAQDLGDRTRLAGVAVTRLGCLTITGDQAGAIEVGERGLAIARDLGHLPLQASATFLLGCAHTGLGSLRRSIELFEISADLLEGTPASKLFGQLALPGVLWRAWILLPLGELGAFPAAIAHGEEAVRIAEAAAQPYSIALSQGMLGRVHALSGELARAIPALERSAMLCREHEIGVLTPLMFGSLGHAYTLAGRVGDALPLMEASIARAEELRIGWWQSRRMTELGEAYLLADRVDDALRSFERALALADAHGERANRAYALRALGETSLRGLRPDLGSAERRFGEALTLAQELGLRPLAARCQQDLGRLHLTYRGS
jgi:DNA-binding SARP family transcriptional activator